MLRVPYYIPGVATTTHEHYKWCVLDPPGYIGSNSARSLACLRATINVCASMNMVSLCIHETQVICHTSVVRHVCVYMCIDVCFIL